MNANAPIPAEVPPRGSLIDGFIDASGEAVQPYYAAFMIEKGYAHASEPFGRDGHNCEYMKWCQACWAEFERANGYTVAHHTRNLRANEFAAWLEQRAIDHAARNAVEGYAASRPTKGGGQ